MASKEWEVVPIMFVKNLGANPYAGTILLILLKKNKVNVTIFQYFVDEIERKYLY